MKANFSFRDGLGVSSRLQMMMMMMKGGKKMKADAGQ